MNIYQCTDHIKELYIHTEKSLSFPIIIHTATSHMTKLYMQPYDIVIYGWSLKILLWETIGSFQYEYTALLLPAIWHSNILRLLSCHNVRSEWSLWMLWDDNSRSDQNFETQVSSILVGLFWVYGTCRALLSTCTALLSICVAFPPLR